MKEVEIKCSECGKKTRGFIKGGSLYMAVPGEASCEKKSEAANKAWKTMHEREAKMTKEERAALSRKRSAAGKKAASTRRRKRIQKRIIN